MSVYLVVERERGKIYAFSSQDLADRFVRSRCFCDRLCQEFIHQKIEIDVQQSADRKTQLYELQMPIDWNGVENDLGDFKNNHEIQLSKRCVTNELESFIQNSLIEWDFPEARATFYALCNTREEALEIFQRKWSEY